MKVRRREAKVKNGSLVSDVDDWRAGNTTNSYRRKSRVVDRIEFGYINNNHVFSELLFTESFLILFHLVLLQFRWLGDIHAEIFI